MARQERRQEEQDQEEQDCVSSPSGNYTALHNHHHYLSCRIERGDRRHPPTATVLRSSVVAILLQILFTLCHVTPVVGSNAKNIGGGRCRTGAFVPLPLGGHSRQDRAKEVVTCQLVGLRQQQQQPSPHYQNHYHQRRPLVGTYFALARLLPSHDDYASTKRRTAFSSVLLRSSQNDDDTRNSVDIKDENQDQDELRSKIISLLSLLGDEKEEEESRFEKQQLLPSSSSSSNNHQHPPKLNVQVYLIGTGLSNRAKDLPLSTLQLLVQADVVLYDALSLKPEEIHRLVPSHCIVESVGKRGDTPGSSQQSDIDSLLLHHATTTTSTSTSTSTTTTTQSNQTTKKKTTKLVLRLKGGDPFLFGRARTEIDTLRAASISYHVIPNLSSCVAGPHLAGIPLTDPLVPAQSFAVFSGTTAAGIGLGKRSTGTSSVPSKNEDKEGVEAKAVKGSSSDIDFGSITVDSLVFLMIGRLDKLEGLCQTLIEQSSTKSTINNSAMRNEGVQDEEGGGGRWNPDTPCAVIRHAGRPKDQQTWRATLSTLVPLIRDSVGPSVTTLSPAILVVGPTASLNLLDE
jgi:siroheme synthase